MSNYKKKIIRSKATANRIKSACSRFYRWAVVSGRIKYNPFSADVGVESFKESVPDEIKIFSVQERKQIIDNLDFLTAQEKMVVMLATYTGMRRGEIMLAEWRDVNLNGETMQTKPETKTGKRIFPLHSELVKFLQEVPEKSKKGKLVKWTKGFSNWDRNGKKLLKRLADFHEGQNVEIKIDKNLFGFYTFRHTFASHLVQRGVSLDKVASWLGHSVDICRKHYARFIPKDQKDNDIDRF